MPHSGKVGVQGNVAARACALFELFDRGQGLLGVEVAEAQGEGVHGAKTGLFGEAFVDEIKGFAFHGAARDRDRRTAWGFQAWPWRVQSRGLRAEIGAHLNDALAWRRQYRRLPCQAGCWGRLRVITYLPLESSARYLPKRCMPRVSGSPSGFMPVILMMASACAAGAKPSVMPQTRPRAQAGHTSRIL